MRIRHIAAALERFEPVPLPRSLNDDLLELLLKSEPLTPKEWEVVNRYERENGNG